MTLTTPDTLDLIAAWTVEQGYNANSEHAASVLVVSRRLQFWISIDHVLIQRIPGGHPRDVNLPHDFVDLPHLSSPEFFSTLKSIIDHHQPSWITLNTGVSGI